SVELRAASLHRDAAPAVGEAGEVLLVAVPLEAAVQLVRDAARGERVVVAGLRAPAEEVVEADGAAGTDETAARADAVLQEAVAVDQRLDEGVVRRLAGDRRRHLEEALAVEVRDVEVHAAVGADGEAELPIRLVAGVVLEIGVLEGDEAPVVDDPR